MSVLDTFVVNKVKYAKKDTSRKMYFVKNVKSCQLKFTFIMHMHIYIQFGVCKRYQCVEFGKGQRKLAIILLIWCCHCNILK
jgi:hypothetical protein